MINEKEKDPAILELKHVVENKLAMKVSFVFADLFEANLGLDNIKEIDLPVFVYVAPTKEKNRLEANKFPSIKRKISILGLILDKHPMQSGQYKSEEVNELINRCRNIGNNLVYNLNKSDISNKETASAITEWPMNEVYFKFDAGLFGVDINFEWDTDTKTTGCFST